MNATTPALLQGWLLMAGLIVAIGAQNALVLRMGLARTHVGAVVLLCTLSDALLVAAGVFGFGALVARSPAALELLRLAGGAFLLWCGARALRRAWAGDARLQAAGARGGVAAALGSAAALTWLNPHVYLDTVVLVGGVGAQLDAGSRVPFAAGAMLASAMWFTLLGYGAAALAPRLAHPLTWRVVDAAVALVMFGIGAQLLAGRI